jgi:hypothetical protein
VFWREKIPPDRKAFGDKKLTPVMVSARHLVLWGEAAQTHRERQ